MMHSSALGPIDQNSADKQRKAHHKVKTGCRACKQRRRKCDERKPKCSGCTRHGTDCIYSQHAKNSSNDTIPKHSDSSAFMAAISNNLSEERSVISIAAPRDLNLDDLELLHQYLTSTCMPTSQLPEVTVQVQRTVPKLAQENPFLMRGVLAQAAVHLSQLRPMRQQHYALLAAKHHSLAMPEFRSTLERMNERNYSALIAYSFSLVWCAFAQHPMLNMNRTLHQNFGNIVWLPGWFYLLRGSCLIVESCRPWITNGSHIVPPIENSYEFTQSTDSRRMTDLIAKLVPISGSSICGNVLSSLHYAFALASMHGHNTPLRNATNFWIGRLPNQYLDSLRDEEPWALVVMAHFSILVHRSETQWYMKGNGARLLQLIVERLSSSWEEYTRWPCEEVCNGSEKVLHSEHPHPNISYELEPV